MKKLLMGMVAFAALYISSCNSADAGDPKVVLTSFFDAMAKKDIATARKLSTADSKAMFDMMEMGLKMQDNSLDDKVKEQYDKSRMEIAEPVISGNKATVNVKEIKSGESLNFVLMKESGAWKVAMDMGTMMNMGMEKMNEKGMDADEMNEMKKEMEKFKNMSADSMKMMLDKGMQAMDSLKNGMKH